VSPSGGPRPVDSVIVPDEVASREVTTTAVARSGVGVDQPRPTSPEGRPAAAPPAATGRKPASPSRRKQRQAARLRARKVHRIVRHVEPWSVLKISLVFYFCLWVTLLIAGAVLWQVALSSGLVDNVESFIQDIFVLKSFTFDAAQVFRAYAVAGLIMVIAATGFTVLMAVLFNLISDLMGGIRVTVIQEETARPGP
jgi:hypothetical protein